MPRIVLERQNEQGPDRITLELRLRIHRSPWDPPSIGGAVKYSRLGPIGRSTSTVSRRYYVESRVEYDEAVRLLRLDGYVEVGW